MKTSPYNAMLAFALCALASATAARAQIISDDFDPNSSSDTNLYTHSPQVEPAGDGTYQVEGAAFFGESLVTQDGETAAKIGADTGGALALPSSPTELDVSASVEVGTVSDAFGSPGRGVLVGFYSGLTTNHSTGDFYGLIVGTTGSLTLYDGATTYSVSDQVPDFSDSDFYTLSYSINRTTGAISDVTLGGATYDFSAAPADAAYTTSNTAYAGIGVSSEAGNTYGYVNTFSVAGASVPEPSTWAMLLAGLVGLVGLQRFARKA